MWGRESARDISVQARGLIQAHIIECKETREETRRLMRDWREDSDIKHEQNRVFQSRIYWAVIALLASALGKIIMDSVHFQIHLGP